VDPHQQSSAGTVRYFGEHWGTSRLAGGVQVRTPVGQPCIRCQDTIAAGDQGILTAYLHGDGNATMVPLHAECELIAILGHDFGVCSCTGYDTTSHDAARDLWRRFHLPGWRKATRGTVDTRTTGDDERPWFKTRTRS
jgi:hypothetical protein